MSCQNCFNGCAEIVSDRCVRYTGIDIPSLGITTGNSLFNIEQSLTDFLLSVMTGIGIHPIIDPDIICNLVGKYLSTCGDLTVVDFITALIKASCDLQEQVINLDQAVAIIEGDYNIDCLATVTASSGTHTILQAVIIKLCQTNVTLVALIATVDNLFNYPNPELDAYLATYLAAHSVNTTLVSNKMIPYVAYPYFSTDLSHFNLNGQGTGDWVNIYLCNGYLGKTPDMRGRVPVASTNMYGPASTDPIVIPGGFNPSYIVGGSLYGNNSVLLNYTTVPDHTHTANATASQVAHEHYIFNTDEPNNGSKVSTITYASVAGNDSAATTYQYSIQGTATTATLGKTSTKTPAVSVDTITINSTIGGGNAHANIQPVIACYYIMFVP